MSAHTVRNALGVIHSDPDDAAAWLALAEGLDAAPAEARELASLLAGARKLHEMRREHR